MLDLLAEPVIRVDNRRMSLPQLLAALTANTVFDYPGMRAHQRDAFHAFLVQLAVTALRNQGRGAPPDSSEAWCDLLVSLTSKHPFAWHLYAPKPDTPAFFQPPVETTEGWDRSTTPAAIDAPRGVKEFDLKIGGMPATVADVDQWMFSLITLQTTTASNSAHYGQTSRVRGGFGGRLFVGLDGTPGGRFVRDVKVILSAWDRLIEDCPGYRQSGGLALTWLEPFKGIIPIDNLDPMFLDTPRRVRLDAQGALTTASPGLRTLGKTIGDTGRIADPWSVINGEGVSLNVTNLSFKTVAAIITGDQDYIPSLLQTPRSTDRAPYALRLSVLTGGRPAQTNGYHERSVEISGRVFQMLQTHAADVAKCARERIDFLGRVQGLIRGAIAQGSKSVHPIASRELASASQTMVNNWFREEDARFFVDLFREIESDVSDRLQIRGEWIDRVISDGRQIVRQGCDALYAAGGHYWKVLVVADGFYTRILNRSRVQANDK